MQASESAVDVGEFRLNVGRTGRGERLVMLHGSDPRENWRIWEPMLGVGESYSLIMPDLIGYGRSSRPTETPSYEVQARVVHELLDKLGVETAGLVGSSWGGQVALEMAINWPRSVKSMILIASTYDVSQVPKLTKLKIPTLILWAEDDMITQTKAGYLLRDAIGTSRVEVLDPVAKDPHQDFTIAHKLERYRSDVVREKVLRFLADPENLIAEPPELEPELKGLAMKEADKARKENA